MNAVQCAPATLDPAVKALLSSINDLLGAAIRSSSDFESVLQATLEAGVRLVGGNRGFLALVNHETGELQVTATTGEGWTEETRRMRLHLGHETHRGITGHVALTGMPYITGCVREDPYYLSYFQDVTSEIAVPILSPTGQTRGVINIDSGQPDAFTADHATALCALSNAGAVALTLQGFRARESALIEIGKSLTTTLEVDAIASKVVQVAATVLQFEDCSVFLVDDQTDHLVLAASCCLVRPRIGSTMYHIGDGLVGWVAMHGEPVRIDDPSGDPRWFSTDEVIEDGDVGPFLAVPIVGREKILGVLRVLRRKAATPWFNNRFTETDEKILATIGTQLGAAIENARAFRQLVRSERMAAWGELSARSAHMIGNRSFALKGDLNELRFLIEALPQSERQQDVMGLVQSMESGVERLEEILREFRDYVVATQVTPADCDISGLVKETLAETFPKRTAVALREEYGADVPVIRCDMRRLKRAFSELIENAVSFMPEGGELNVRVHLLTAEERASHRLAHSRNWVEIMFADDGPGVPEDLKDRIFRPFYTSRVKGMGLGLSIVKGIVEAHEGIIRETGQPGKGARFVIFLPAEPG